MKKAIILLLTILICCSAMVPMTTATATASKGVKEEFLNSDKWISLSKNTSGPRYFVDAKGNPVNLFGMARSQSYTNDENRLYSNMSSSDDLFEHYADYGMNFIRLALNITSICGGKKLTDAEIDEYITQSIDPDVQAIIRNGMYVMLDIHMYPQEDKNVRLDTFEKFIQYPRDYYTPVLKGLARMYKDEPMVAVYEIWNEPVAADRAMVPYDYNEWNTGLREYFMEAVEEIRKIDTKHVIMVSDHNAGWGHCTDNTWGGYYNKIDPVYRNTCFSVHVAKSHVTTSLQSYKNWYKSLTKNNNICIIFGEIETEGDLMSAEGMKNLLNFFSETEKEHHFSGVLWRPHSESGEYTDLWGTNGWAKKYCTPLPTPSARYSADAEDRYGDKNDNIELLKESGLFGYATGNGISMKAGLSATQFYEGTAEISSNVIYKEGKYKLVVRAVGKKGYEGDFIVGYRDIDGVVHQIARFAGKNTSGSVYYQSVEFTAKKQIVSFVYFGCESSKKSAIIDRVYISGAESDKETTSRSRTDFADINKIIDLNGKTITLSSGNSNQNNSSNDNKTESKPDSSENGDTDNNGDNVVDQKDSQVDSDSADVNSGAQGDKTTTTTTKTTTKGSGSMIYVWIGIILGAVAVLFVIIYVIVVVIKKRKKKAE